MATINKFIDAERILLEIDDKYKFKLSFNDMLKLRDYINSVGELTSFYFNIQSDFFKKTQDINELSKFNDRISNEEIDTDLNFDELKKFINRIVNQIGSNDLYNLLDKLNC